MITVSGEITQTFATLKQRAVFSPNLNFLRILIQQSSKTYKNHAELCNINILDLRFFVTLRANQQKLSKNFCDGLLFGLDLIYSGNIYSDGICVSNSVVGHITR